MPYLDTLANLLGVAVASATLGRFTSQALRRVEKRLSARLDSAVASLDSKLTNENASLDLKLTSQIENLDLKLTGQLSALDAKINSLDTKVDALGVTLSERIDVVSMRLSSTEARLEKLDDRVYMLAARLSPELQEPASAHPPADQ